MKDLLEIANKESSHVFEWCCFMNKLSLNVDKTKYIHFQKQREKDNIPLRLSDLRINIISLRQISKLKVFKCLFGLKPKLAESHSINMEGNFKKYRIIIQSKSCIIEKISVAALLFLYSFLH